MKCSASEVAEMYNSCMDAVDTNTLYIRYVPLDEIPPWKNNPKKHDMGGLIKSMQMYGFRDPPKIDNLINRGQPGISQGNGRTDALKEMRKRKMKPPRGVKVEPESKRWLVPVVFGVDSESAAQAERYALDHNNLTLSGGDLDAFDMGRMWEMETYLSLLREVQAEGGELASIDRDEMDEYLFAMSQQDELDGEEEGESRGGRALKNIVVAVHDMKEYDTLAEDIADLIQRKNYKAEIVK